MKKLLLALLVGTSVCSTVVYADCQSEAAGITQYASDHGYPAPDNINIQYFGGTNKLNNTCYTLCSDTKNQYVCSWPQGSWSAGGSYPQLVINKLVS